MQGHYVCVVDKGGLELGNSSWVSIASQELFFKAASTGIKLFGDS